MASHVALIKCACTRSNSVLPVAFLERPNAQKGLIEKVLLVAVWSSLSPDLFFVPSILLCPALQVALPLVGHFRENIDAGADIFTPLSIVRGTRVHGARPMVAAVLQKRVEVFLSRLRSRRPTDLRRLHSATAKDGRHTAPCLPALWRRSGPVELLPAGITNANRASLLARRAHEEVWEQQHFPYEIEVCGLDVCRPFTRRRYRFLDIFRRMTRQLHVPDVGPIDRKASGDLNQSVNQLPSGEFPCIPILSSEFSQQSAQEFSFRRRAAWTSPAFSCDTRHLQTSARDLS